jgi:hypothetical protein
VRRRGRGVGGRVTSSAGAPLHKNELNFSAFQNIKPGQGYQLVFSMPPYSDNSNDLNDHSFVYFKILVI